MKNLLPIALLALACGCSAFDAAFPEVGNIVSIVAKDFAAGDGEAQIASDVCAALGGTASTDVICSDVATVIADAIGLLLKDPKVPAADKLKMQAALGHIQAGTFAK